MGKKFFSKALKIVDPFDLTGAKRGAKKNERLQQQLASQQAVLVNQEEERRKQAEEEATAKADEEAALKAADELSKKQGQARRAGISQALEQEGAQTGRRRFLTGAK